MGDKSNIEWTEATWNPTVGCSKVSPGCQHCYAIPMSRRIAAAADARDTPCTERQRGYQAVVKRDAKGVPLPQWNNKVVCLPSELEIPLRWKRARRIFVNSMSDLFHPDVPFEFVDRVFAVMALCPQHTFQVLTKRPERMAEYLRESTSIRDIYGVVDDFQRRDMVAMSMRGLGPGNAESAQEVEYDANSWPLPNVWLGTSCEDQAAADERIPHLLRCPAAVRFVSAEPLLGPIDLSKWLDELVERDNGVPFWKHGRTCEGACDYGCNGGEAVPEDEPYIGWVIVGGESGKGARACDMKWVKSIRNQCRRAGVPFFFKQAGAMAYDTSGPGLRLDTWEQVIAATRRHYRDSHGGDPSEWSEDLRIREFPNTKGPAVPA